jgi:uncharacterized protein DUF3850
MSTEHRLRLDTEPFEATLRGERTAEHRWVGDRRYDVGDTVVLTEAAPRARRLRMRIVRIDTGPEFGIRRDYAVLHLAPMEEE